MLFLRGVLRCRHERRLLRRRVGRGAGGAQHHGRARAARAAPAARARAAAAGAHHPGEYPPYHPPSQTNLMLLSPILRTHIMALSENIFHLSCFDTQSQIQRMFTGIGC